ncbi:MAG: AraC family transcriptional regulator [Paracoccaceae bacterium]
MNFEHVFNELEIATDPFAICELQGQCDLGMGKDAAVTLHYVLSGKGQIQIAGRPPLKVAKGSFVLIPALQSHNLRSFGYSDDLIPDCKPAELKLASLMAGTEEQSASQLTALCAHVTIGLRGVTDIIELIREPLVEYISDTSEVKHALAALLIEISNPRLGSRAMIRAILTQCLIEMLRKRLGERDSTFRWMAALADPSVWNALRLMLDGPGDPHTVESLAAHVGMSRSAFAKRFADAYGSGPMELLRELRVHQAARLLSTTDLPVKRIAALVGFASRSAFTRLFESKTNQSPKSFRAMHRNSQ